MRMALAIATVTLTLGLASRTTSALQAGDNVSPLDSIQMIDAQIGWAVTARCDPCPPDVVPGLVLRTTNGGTQWRDVTPVDSSGKRTGVVHFYVFNSQIAWVTRATSGVAQCFFDGQDWDTVAWSVSSTKAAAITITVPAGTFTTTRWNWQVAFSGDCLTLSITASSYVVGRASEIRVDGATSGRGTYSYEL